VNWLLWRPVMAGHATKTEVEKHWTIGDLLDYHEAADIEAEAQEHARQRAERKA
jgi:hypothetical protein